MTKISITVPQKKFQVSIGGKSRFGVAFQQMSFHASYLIIVY